MKKNKKYELTNECDGINTRYRIRALRDFSDVKTGDLGGFIEYEDNLSHKGNCWVYYGARVMDNARVYDNAKICGGAMIFNNARIYGNAYVCDFVWIFNDARVYDNAKIIGNARISGDANICGNAYILLDLDDSVIKGNIKINYGIWNNMIVVDQQKFLISTTLEKLPMGKLNG